LDVTLLIVLSCRSRSSATFFRLRAEIFQSPPEKVLLKFRMLSATLYIVLFL